MRHFNLRLRAGHNFKAWVEVDHGRSKLLQNAWVTFYLCCSVRDLRIESFRTHHCLLQIRAFNGEGQIGLFGKKAHNVGERGIL